MEDEKTPTGAGHGTSGVDNKNNKSPDIVVNLAEVVNPIQMPGKNASVLDWARYYVALGFSVIPIRYKDKLPAIKSWKEFQTRKPTDSELAKWFGSGILQNIAIVTGQVSGITVVDCDSNDAFEYVISQPIDATATVMTGRYTEDDRCMHFYCLYADGVRNFQNKTNFPGIDLRGDGGYVLAPPSVHPNGNRYKWDVTFDELCAINSRGLAKLPDWVKKASATGTAINADNMTATTNVSATLTVQNIIDRCGFMKYCWHNQVSLPEPVWYAMITNLGRSVGGPNLCHEFSKGYTKYKAGEVNSKILHALNDAKPHSCETCKQLMKNETGGQDCGKTCKYKSPVANLQVVEEVKSVDKLIIGASPQLARRGVRRLIESIPPPVEFVIPPTILPRGVVGILAGLGGYGKGLLSLQSAIAISCGLPFLGLNDTVTQPQRVLFASAEDNDDELHRRYRDIVESMVVNSPHPDDARAKVLAGADNLEIFGDEFFPMPGLYHKKSGGFKESETYKRLSTFAADFKPGLIIVDTLTLFFAEGDENNRVDMGLALLYLKQLSKIACNATVLAIHHLNKGAFNEETMAKDPLATIRGSSAVVANSRWVALLHDNKLIVAKSNYSELCDYNLMREGRLWQAVDVVVERYRINNNGVNYERGY